MNKTPVARSEFAGTMIKVIDYDPSRHLVKVVRKKDNKPLIDSKDRDSAPLQKKEYEHPLSKILKTSSLPDSPIIEVTDDMASIRGNSNYGFFSFREGGANIIKGPLSIGAQPHQVRLSGITTLNPLLTSGFPSTIVTPMPTCVWSIPTSAMVKPLMESVMVAGTLAAALI